MQALQNIDGMLVVLALAGLFILASFWRMHSNPAVEFNALDLLMENGRVSKISVAFMIVLAVTTWLMIDLQIKGDMTEGYMGLYCTAWVTPLVAKVIFGKSEPPISGTTPTAAPTAEG